MKELSIEEKAKRYDLAIEKAKSKIKNDKDHVLYEDDVIDIFPELKESAYNDVMREMAIKAVYAPEAQSCIKSWGIEPDSVISWLEKQGEQKPAWSKEMGSLCFEAASLLSDYSEGVDVDSQLGRKISRAKAFLIDLYHEAFYPNTYNPRPDLMPVKSVEWSKEDKYYYDIIQYVLNNECVGKTDKENAINWFKSIKDRVQLKVTQKGMY